MWFLLRSRPCLLLPCTDAIKPLQVQDLVESVRKVRFTKVDSGLRILSGPMTVKLNNLSAMECNLIRPFFAGVLDRFYPAVKGVLGPWIAGAGARPAPA